RVHRRCCRKQRVDGVEQPVSLALGSGFRQGSQFRNPSRQLEDDSSQFATVIDAVENRTKLPLGTHTRVPRQGFREWLVWNERLFITSASQDSCLLRRTLPREFHRQALLPNTGLACEKEQAMAHTCLSPCARHLPDFGIASDERGRLRRRADKR